MASQDLLTESMAQDPAATEPSSLAAAVQGELAAATEPQPPAFSIWPADDPVSIEDLELPKANIQRIAKQVVRNEHYRLFQNRIRHRRFSILAFDFCG